MTRLTAFALVATLAATLGAGGCAAPATTPRSRASAAALAACRTRTDQAYDRQNRYLLSERDTRDSPFSTSGTTGITTTGLSQRYARDNMFDSCIGSNAPDSGSGPAFSPGQTPTGPSSLP